MADAIKILLKAQDNTKAAFRSVDNNMTKLRKSSKLMAAALGPIGAFASAGALVAIGKQAISAADDIQKMSQRLDISTEALSQYQHVADLSGTSFESLAKGISKSQRAIADADDGLSTAVRAIKDAGLELAALKKLSPEDAFEALGEAVAGIEDPFTRASAAAAIFGRAGKEMLPIFNKGAEAVREMREEADRLGLTLSQDAADNAAEAADAMQRLDSAMKGLQVTIASIVSEPLADFLNDIVQVATQQTPFQQMTAGMQRLKMEMPLAYAEIRQMQKNTEGMTVAMTLAAIAAADLQKASSVSAFGGDLLGMSKAQATKDEAAALDAMNDSLKERGSALEEMDILDSIGSVEAILRLVELTEQIDAFNMSLKDTTSELTEMDGIQMNQSIGNDILIMWDNAASQVSRTARVMRDEGVNAAQTFGDAIVTSALRGEDALSSLGNVARSVFGSIISSFLSIGINTLFNPASAVSPDFIGPLQKSAATEGGTTINGGLHVKANTTLNNDPMSLTRLAEQLQDKLIEVGKRRGAS